MHYTELEVWQEAMDLAVEIYAVTTTLPREERFGLIAQMRRAADSIPSNTAEGEGRRSWRDRSHFYLQARGSLYELETQIFIAERLGYLHDETGLHERVSSVGKLINGMLRSLKARSG